MIRKCVSWYLVVAMFAIAAVTPAQATFSPSDLVQVPSVRTADMNRVQVVLENKLVMQRLQDLGYSTTEITTKLSQMSDEQIHSFAQKLDDLKVGGDGFGVVIGVLVIIALVLVIVYLMGHKVSVK